MSPGARRFSAGALSLALSACATAPPPAPTRPMARLPGWDAEDHAAAFGAVRQACADRPSASRDAVCRAAVSAGPLGEAAARAFLETRFRAEPIEGEGLLTAYFSPTYPARITRDGEFSAPVRPPTAETEGLTRAEIDRRPAADALAWMRPEDVFLLQIQGSGVLVFEDGGRRRAVYAGNNGRPFVAIAGSMVAEGLLAPGEASSAVVHAWLAAHRGPAAEAEMGKDPRYIFFHLAPEAAGEPAGASGARLIPGRSVAVDPTRHPDFELLWIDATRPALAGARPAYRRLVVAMDRGGAIAGAVRADLYLGSGDVAGDEAARVRHALRLYRIVPVQP
ncbi:MAG TPA: MltA domain-containing protein [Caulobacteraceae bacterium]|nr:MltA domain-containing protein [Caulobacteraceae bacterium]